MREISFVSRLKFNFNGSVTKKALVIGDADNDQHNELVCANLQGDLAVFKGRNPNCYAYACELGMVTACVIGDVINSDKNHVAAINTEGWLFIFDVTKPAVSEAGRHDDIGSSAGPCGGSSTLVVADGHTWPVNSGKEKVGSPSGSDLELTGFKLTPLYDQRMPANCKELLLADLDGDGQNELIVGLTDRVLRTYKWINIGPDRGKFVGLYKWEFADQIGAVSLNPSRHKNCQDIIVAQPGGTYAKLECFDKKPSFASHSTSSSSTDHKSNVGSDDTTQHVQSQQNLLDSPTTDDNVRTEYISKLTPEYHQLALSQMRNHHISTEVLGGIKDGKDSDSYSLIVIATLDGTLMLVNKDEILWSLQVDHQLFALAILEPNGHRQPVLTQSESTCTIVPNLELADRPVQLEDQMNNLTLVDRPRRSQYFAVCAWNGKTYIIDEERNYLRFKFDEAVSAFAAGNYHFDGKEHTSLVYATFNNQIVLYYDVIIDHIRPMFLLNEVLNNPENASLLGKLETLARKLEMPLDAGGTGDDRVRRSTYYELLRDILYGVTDEELTNW